MAFTGYFMGEFLNSLYVQMHLLFSWLYSETTICCNTICSDLILRNELFHHLKCLLQTIVENSIRVERTLCLIGIVNVNYV